MALGYELPFHLEPLPGSRIHELNYIDKACEEWRARLEVKRKQKPLIRFYKNKDNGDPGLEYVGRVHFDDTIRANFPFQKNVAAQGILELRTDHYMAKWLRDMVVTEEAKKNIVIIVDYYGGELRWSGLLQSHSVKVGENGLRTFECKFMDDLQFLQYMLAPPNPALPIPIFQFPRVFVLAGPAKWAISVLILINLLRLQGNVWSLPDDPFDLDQYDNWLDWNDWQVHIKCSPFLLDDSSLWVMLASRMNPIDAAIADALDDAQLTLRYRRVLSDEGEVADGLLFVPQGQVANGALVFELTDDSGYRSPLKGTFLEGTIADGFVRSVATYAGGTIEDLVGIIDDNQGLYPDSYWGPGFLGTLAEAPWLVIRDNAWTEAVTSELSWSPATAVSVCIGGGNPTADAVARLIIETTGNLLGYFLLGGFSSAGVIAADIIMPFLEGTILAWLYHKNRTRAQNLGWVHLFEMFQTGADQNAWSLSAIGALRGGFLASRSQTSHTISLKGTRWILPGLHFSIGSRVGSTVKEYPNHIFVNQVEEMTFQWDHTGETGLEFEVKIGDNKAALSHGERSARAFQKLATTLQSIGVNLISG